LGGSVLTQFRARKDARTSRRRGAYAGGLVLRTALIVLAIVVLAIVLLHLL